MDELVNKGLPTPTRYALPQVEGGKRGLGRLYSGDMHTNVQKIKGQMRANTMCLYYKNYQGTLGGNDQNSWDGGYSITAHLVQEWPERQNIAVMVHLAYSPDLTQCDFWLFPTLKRDLKGLFFESDEEVIHKIQKSLTRIPEAEFRKIIEEKWVERLEQCIATKDGSNANDSKCKMIIYRVIHECCNPDFKRTKLPMQMHKKDQNQWGRLLEYT